MRKRETPPKSLIEDEIKLWNEAQEYLGYPCATFGAPTIIRLLKKLSAERKQVSNGS